MLDKSLLLFFCASERRDVDSQVHEGSQTILKCYEDSIRGELCCCAEAEMSFQVWRYLKLREEHCGGKHLGKTHELWISFLSYYKIWRIWVLFFQCSVCCDLVIQVHVCRISKSEGPWGKAVR